MIRSRNIKIHSVFVVKNSIDFWEFCIKKYEYDRLKCFDATELAMTNCDLTFHSTSYWTQK